MLIELLFTVAKGWKQPKCPSVNEWIIKQWYIHTKEYYSVLKRSELLNHEKKKENHFSTSCLLYFQLVNGCRGMLDFRFYKCK